MSLTIFSMTFRGMPRLLGCDRLQFKKGSRTYVQIWTVNLINSSDPVNEIGGNHCRVPESVNKTY